MRDEEFIRRMQKKVEREVGGRGIRERKGQPERAEKRVKMIHARCVTEASATARSVCEDLRSYRKATGYTHLACLRPECAD